MHVQSCNRDAITTSNDDASVFLSTLNNARHVSRFLLPLNIKYANWHIRNFNMNVSQKPNTCFAVSEKKLRNQPQFTLEDSRMILTGCGCFIVNSEWTFRRLFWTQSNLYDEDFFWESRSLFPLKKPITDVRLGSNLIFAAFQKRSL